MLRIEEKGKNKGTLKDAREALQAIDAATAVLKDFYAKASSATAFLQEGRPRMGSSCERPWDLMENADATPPHLDVFPASGKLQRFAWVFAGHVQQNASKRPSKRP